MENLTDNLIKLAPFDYDESCKQKGSDFYNAVMEELSFHYDNNTLYRKFCDNKSFNPHTFNEELAEIPPVSVSVFKELGSELTSVPKENIKLTLQSSATNGVPSSIPVDKETARRQAKVMIRIIQEFIGKERKPFLIMDVDPASGFRHLLGARFAAVGGYLNFASKVGYFLKVNNRHQYYFDTEGIRSYLSQIPQDQPCVVFGFTYILFSEVICPNLDNNTSFHLPKGSKVIHIGGWKKLESEKISKDAFNDAASRLFGIEPKDIIDIYGFTEQMGLNYPDCDCGCKHASIYSDVIVRDVSTKAVLPPGKEGMLEFVSPIPHSYPGNAVLTDDIGVLIDGECPYGRAGKRFIIKGRLKKAEVRGCGDILSSKLKFVQEKMEKQVEYATEQLKIEFYKGTPLTSGLTSSEQLKTIISSLKEKQTWLRKQPVDALIGLIGNVAKKWSSTDDAKMSVLQEQGLAFLSAWCAPEHLTRIATTGLRGNRMYADAFLPVLGSKVQMQRATPRGLVCHWLAGNVQVLGMFALVQCILTKNVNLLKISSKDNGVFHTLLSAFENSQFTTSGGYTIKGSDLLKTIAVVYFKHTQDELGHITSQSANVRVAWGGKEAVQAVAGYPSSFDCEDVILGPKLSYSVIANDVLNDERKTRKLARKVAVDCSVFDQTGCASSHNVFIERGGKIPPIRFAELLAESMQKVALQIPKGMTSREQIAAIHSIRGVYDFTGQVFASDDSTWTVLYSDDSNLHKPVYSRVVFVHPVNHIEDTLCHIDENTQTIGLAAEGSKALSFANKAVEAGTMRLPDCGKMLNFESPWDGIYIMERLVRWNTLGGPLV